MSSAQPASFRLEEAGGRHFVAACYEIFLGRDLDDPSVAEERGRWPGDEILRSVVGSAEFADSVARPLLTGRPFPGHLFVERLTVRHRYWILAALPMDEPTIGAIWAAADWRGLITALLADERMMRAAGLAVLVDFPPLETPDDQEPGEDEQQAEQGSDARPLWTGDVEPLRRWR